MPASGNDLDFTGVAIHRIGDGRIVEHWSEVDTLTAMAQMGAIPPAPA